MGKFLCGAAFGIALGYMIRKMQEEKKFDKFANDINRFADQTKKKVKNLVDMGQNEAEYVADRAEYVAEKGKQKLSEARKDVLDQDKGQEKR